MHNAGREKEKNIIRYTEKGKQLRNVEMKIRTKQKKIKNKTKQQPTKNQKQKKNNDWFQIYTL
jgi:hypothetical protein